MISSTDRPENQKSNEQLISFDSNQLPFAGIPGGGQGRNRDNTAYKSCTTIQGNGHGGDQNTQYLTPTMANGNQARGGVLTDAYSVRTGDVGKNAMSTSVEQQSQFGSLSKSKRAKSSTTALTSKSKKTVNRKKEEAELIAKREFKKYVVRYSNSML